MINDEASTPLNRPLLGELAEPPRDRGPVQYGPSLPRAQLTVEPLEVRLRNAHADHVVRVPLHKLQKHARLSERLFFRLLVQASDSDCLAAPLQDSG